MSSGNTDGRIPSVSLGVGTSLFRIERNAFMGSDSRDWENEDWWSNGWTR